jgi:putative acetyltransferase
MRVTQVHSSEEIPTVQRLWRMYEHLIDESLDYQGFEAELASLPGVYAPPQGGLFLAWCAGDAGERAVGTAALRQLYINDQRGPACELKRMVVEPAWRGRGVGQLLVQAVTQAASAHYRVIKLDTSPRWLPAISLYRRCGFVPCDRYNDDPHADTLFMELELG